jgi:hypothetical protein
VFGKAQRENGKKANGSCRALFPENRTQKIPLFK